MSSNRNNYSTQRQEVLDGARKELESSLSKLLEKARNSERATVQISIGLAAIVASNPTFRYEAIAIASEVLGVHTSKIFFVNAGSASAIGVERQQNKS